RGARPHQARQDRVRHRLRRPRPDRDRHRRRGRPRGAARLPRAGPGDTPGTPMTARTDMTDFSASRTELRVIQSGVATFFGRPLADPGHLDGVRCAIVGIPWDEGNAGRNGANMGPRAFRDVSSWFLGYDAQRDFDLWEALPTADVGDSPVVPPNAERTMQLIEEHVRSVRERGILPLSVGGNHALAIGAARGAARTVPRMGYLSVDAHLDTAPSWAGEIYSSGCPTMRATEIPNVDPANVVVFGVHGWLNPRDQVRAAA